MALDVSEFLHFFSQEVELRDLVSRVDTRSITKKTALRFTEDREGFDVVRKKISSPENLELGERDPAAFLQKLVDALYDDRYRWTENAYGTLRVVDVLKVRVEELESRLATSGLETPPAPDIPVLH